MECNCIVYYKRDQRGEACGVIYGCSLNSYRIKNPGTCRFWCCRVGGRWCCCCWWWRLFFNNMFCQGYVAKSTWEARQIQFGNNFFRQMNFFTLQGKKSFVLLQFRHFYFYFFIWNEKQLILFRFWSRYLLWF